VALLLDYHLFDALVSLPILLSCVTLLREMILIATERIEYLLQPYNLSRILL
jgi:hypothetical protein